MLEEHLSRFLHFEQSLCQCMTSQHNSNSFGLLCYISLVLVLWKLHFTNFIVYPFRCCYSLFHYFILHFMSLFLIAFGGTALILWTENLHTFSALFSHDEYCSAFNNVIVVRELKYFKQQILLTVRNPET